MSSGDSEIAHEFHPYFRAYKDGRVERFFGSDIVPASIDPQDGVSSKDVPIVPETGVSARIFIPSSVKPSQKLPLVVYFHGGGFFMGSPFCSEYHNYVTSLVSEANVVAVSVDYRLAPEHLIPIAYEDSWAALRWVASHCSGEGPEAWLKDYADFQRVFLVGDSAGGNIVHNMAVQAATEDLSGVKLLGICLIQPFFGRKDGHVDKCWLFVSPTSRFDDPRINPAVDSRLSRLGCSRVLTFLAEKDNLRERELFFCETLKSSGWGGELVIVETEGEDHAFQLFNQKSERALALMNRLVSFINQDKDASM
ncbi:probable carboxylesterase 12 [Herrania umbratica]|uniref:Probable carboxylesterase 12 n=1 Tax=Herrania umbratica TaxID=108875 RepID=A0A6J1BMN3_9ROSI|nr:probable carboxylesterase 12 [Herrania umbratica]